jgi:hypothetical protein
MKRIGLIAGSGQFPILFAEAARKCGVQVVAVAFEGETDRRIEPAVDRCCWITLGKLGKLISIFQDAEVNEAVMAGAVDKTKLYSKIRPDWKAVRLLARMVHKRDDTLLRAIAEELDENGIRIRSSTMFLPQLLAPTGTLTRRKPDARESKDIEFGWSLVKEIGKLDIGQCLVIKDQSVLAVEAIEGTDETIRRGGSLGRGKAVVIKASKPSQDLRFDVPAVGLQTIETMRQVRASVLVVEAGKTLMFDREQMIDAANRARIAIVCKSAVEEEPVEHADIGEVAAAVGIGDQAARDAPLHLSSPEGRSEAARVAVVGVGYLGPFHAEKYAAIDEARLVAVVDVDTGRAGEIAERVSCEALGSHRELIGKVDAVSVVVPTQEHFQICRDLLEAGIHVLVEKPMTSTLEEADLLIHLAQANNLVLQVGHLERFNPAILAARAHVRRPFFIESHRLASFTERGTEVNVVLDLMIHDIDIILSLVPHALEDLRAIGVKVLTHYTDIANVRLEFANGCIANVTASRISAKKMRKIRIFQPDSYLSIDYADKVVEVFRKLPERAANGFPEIEYECLPVADTDPLEEQLRSFTRSVQTGERPLVSGTEGRKALEVATRVSDLIQAQIDQLGATFGFG